MIFGWGFPWALPKATLCMAVGQIDGGWAAAGSGADVRRAIFKESMVERYRGKPVTQRCVVAVRKTAIQA